MELDGLRVDHAGLDRAADDLMGDRQPDRRPDAPPRRGAGPAALAVGRRGPAGLHRGQGAVGRRHRRDARPAPAHLGAGDGRRTRSTARPTPAAPAPSVDEVPPRVWAGAGHASPRAPAGSTSPCRAAVRVAELVPELARSVGLLDAAHGARAATGWSPSTAASSPPTPGSSARGSRTAPCSPSRRRRRRAPPPATTTWPRRWPRSWSATSPVGRGDRPTGTALAPRSCCCSPGPVALLPARLRPRRDRRGGVAVGLVLGAVGLSRVARRHRGRGRVRLDRLRLRRGGRAPARAGLTRSRYAGRRGRRGSPGRGARRRARAGGAPDPAAAAGGRSAPSSWPPVWPRGPSPSDPAVVLTAAVALVVLAGSGVPGSRSHSARPAHHADVPVDDVTGIDLARSARRRAARPRDPGRDLGDGRAAAGARRAGRGLARPGRVPWSRCSLAWW